MSDPLIHGHWPRNNKFCIVWLWCIHYVSFTQPQGFEKKKTFSDLQHKYPSSRPYYVFAPLLVSLWHSWQVSFLAIHGSLAQFAAAFFPISSSLIGLSSLGAASHWYDRGPGGAGGGPCVRNSQIGPTQAGLAGLCSHWTLRTPHSPRWPLLYEVW